MQNIKSSDACLHVQCVITAWLFTYMQKHRVLWRILC